MPPTPAAHPLIHPALTPTPPTTSTPRRRGQTGRCASPPMPTAGHTPLPLDPSSHDPDPARIRAAWGRRAYNVGIACGPSGLVVIDLDTSKPGEHPPQPWAGMVGIGDGQDVFTVLAEQATGDPLPAATYTVATPSGGLHLYYAPLAGVALRNTE